MLGIEELKIGMGCEEKKSRVSQSPVREEPSKAHTEPHKAHPPGDGVMPGMEEPLCFCSKRPGKNHPATRAGKSPLLPARLRCLRCLVTSALGEDVSDGHGQNRNVDVHIVRRCVKRHGGCFLFQMGKRGLAHARKIEKS